MSPEFKPLVEEFQRGVIGRREFIQRVIIAAGGLAAAAPLLHSLGISETEAAQVDPNDPTLESKTVQFPGKAGTIWAYHSRPKTGTNLPAVIVVHENRGLNPHIEDVARRLARQGYIALAPDYLSRHGGTAKIPDAQKGIGNIRDLAPAQAVSEDTEAAVAYLKGQPGVRADRVGVVGFCWGGQMAFHIGTQIRGLKAVTVFYGRTPNHELLQQIEAPILAHYGEEDKGITDAVPETAEAMKRYGKSFTYKIFPKAKHAFHNETNPERYHAEAAKEAWEHTLAFFAQHLKA
jgi:carboxymethylenebutenolidase